ncbi:RNA-binding CRS1 / YhbY (CRM) domain protein [Wolffia australiana]
MASVGAAAGFRQRIWCSSSLSLLRSSHSNPIKGLIFPSLRFALSFSSSKSHPSLLSTTQFGNSLPLVEFRRLFSSSVVEIPLVDEEEESEWEDDEIDEVDDGLDEEVDEEVDDVVAELPRYPSPVLSIKEKKELASYAHSLGKKLKSQQVGKSGVTPTLISAFSDALEANELLKLKVHGNCPGELPDVIRLLESSTGSVAVGRIGRSVILYRPSISKMQQAREQKAVKSPRRLRPFKSPSSRPGGPRDQTKRPFLRRSSSRPSAA